MSVLAGGEAGVVGVAGTVGTGWGFIRRLRLRVLSLVNDQLEAETVDLNLSDVDRLGAAVSSAVARFFQASSRLPVSDSLTSRSMTLKPALVRNLVGHFQALAAVGLTGHQDYVGGLADIRLRRGQAESGKVDVGI